MRRIKQEGSVVTFPHPDVHELTGSLEGVMIETGTLRLDLGTGTPDAPILIAASFASLAAGCGGSGDLLPGNDVTAISVPVHPERALTADG